MGFLYRFNNANKSMRLNLQTNESKHEHMFNCSLSHFRLLFSSVPFWLCYFRCSDFVRDILISIKCSSGCGILAISELVSMVSLKPFTVWIVRTYTAHLAPNIAIVISKSQPFFYVKWASVSSIPTIIFIWWLALFLPCMCWPFWRCGLNLISGRIWFILQFCIIVMIHESHCKCQRKTIL